MPQFHQAAAGHVGVSIHTRDLLSTLGKNCRYFRPFGYDSFADITVLERSTCWSFLDLSGLRSLKSFSYRHPPCPDPIVFHWISYSDSSFHFLQPRLPAPMGLSCSKAENRGQGINLCSAAEKASGPEPSHQAFTGEREGLPRMYFRAGMWKAAVCLRGTTGLRRVGSVTI